MSGALSMRRFWRPSGPEASGGCARVGRMSTPIDVADLLHSATSAQRAELQMVSRQTYDALSYLDAQDPYGKACCWLPRGAAPATALEQLVLHIAEHDLQRARQGAACDLRDITGFEWWLQVRRPADGMPFHHDTNWADADQGFADFSFAACSSATYLSDAGGPLVVLDGPNAVPSAGSAATGSDWRSAYERQLNETIRASAHAGGHVFIPRFGKHVAFSGAAYHGVLDDAVLRRADEQPQSGSGERMALVVAYWSQPMR